MTVGNLMARKGLLEKEEEDLDEEEEEEKSSSHSPPPRSPPPLIPPVTLAALMITSFAAPTHVETTTSAFPKIETAAMSSASSKSLFAACTSLEVDPREASSFFLKVLTLWCCINNASKV